MKKVFFLIAFLFTVVCYAAQPPDYPASFQTEDVEFIQTGGDFDIQNIQVQEDTFENNDDCYFVKSNLLCTLKFYSMLN